MKKLLLFLLVCSAALVSYAQDTTLNEYKGKFKFPEGGLVPEVEITMADNVLTISAVLGSASMEKVSRDTFTIPTYGNAMVYFGRDSDGKISTLKIDTGTDVLEGKKELNSLALVPKNYLWRSRYAVSYLI